MLTKECPECDGTGKVINSVEMGPKMKSERLKHKVSQAHVARMMRVTAPYLCDLELGRRKWNNELIARFKLALKK